MGNEQERTGQDSGGYITAFIIKQYNSTLEIRAEVEESSWFDFETKQKRSLNNNHNNNNNSDDPEDEE